MSKYTAEQVDDVAISIYRRNKKAYDMLRYFAQRLRQHEAAKAVVTDEGFCRDNEIEALIGAVQRVQQTDDITDASEELLNTVIHGLLKWSQERVATMLASARVPDVLPTDVRIESWPMQQGGMKVGLPRGVKITHIATDRICICNSERSQHKNRDIALAGIKAMLAAAPKRGEG